MFLFLRYLHKLIALRRAGPADDLLTALVQAEEADDKLLEDELAGNRCRSMICMSATTDLDPIGSGWSRFNNSQHAAVLQDFSHSTGV